MTVLLANHFPNATVYGVDLSPVPEAIKAEARHSGRRVEFIQGNIDNLIDQHLALGSGTVDFILHRFLAAALPSYLDYLRETVFPLLRPGGQVEMRDVTGAQFYHSDLKVAGSATCVSRDWYWFSGYKEAMQRRGTADRCVNILCQSFITHICGVQLQQP